jgi:hypothetical protein
MDRADLSAAIIQEMGAVFTGALAEALPALLETDLAGMEQQLRRLARTVLGQVVERVVPLHAQAAEEERGACPACQGRLACVDPARPRQLQGLGGDDRFQRAS